MRWVSFVLVSLVCCACHAADPADAKGPGSKAGGAKASASKAGADGVPYWNQFRGPDDGKSEVTGLPTEFSETSKLKWKTPLDGKAWSSPVVWKDQIWLTNAEPDGKKLYAVCLDAETGKVVHNLLVFEIAKPQYCHPVNSYASSTPYIEEGRIYVHFGAHGTAAIDTASGKTLWTRQDLPCDHFRGPASSPIVYGDTLYILFDGFDYQYVVALNKNDGKTLWKQDRSFVYQTKDGDAKKAYGTPSLVEHAGRKLLLCPAAEATEALDPQTGTVLWHVRHGGMNAAARPIYWEGLAYLTNGMGSLLAVKPEGEGDISKNIAWQTNKQAPKKASMLLIDGLLYTVADSGILSCFDPKTGDVVWSERFGGNHAASPIYADGKIYVCSEDGHVRVVKPGRTFKLLANNQLADGFMASPAIAGKGLILRTRKAVYRFEE